MSSGSLSAVINSKSGARGSAPLLVTNFQDILGPANVLDIGEKEGRDRMTDFLGPNRTAGGRVVVAGGDGTVAWIMDTIDKCDWSGREDEKPHIAVIPLGTGNDFARALGWGPGFTAKKGAGRAEVDTLHQGVINGTPCLFDRWALKIQCRDPTNGQVVDVPKVFTMNNYFSIGVDASVADEFDRFRENHPGLAKSRAANKFWYGILGLQAMGKPVISSTVKLTVDSRAVELPPKCRSLVVCNIGSFGAGIKPWHGPEPSSPTDQKLEILCFNGSSHLGRAKVKLSKAIPITQGSEITIQCMETPPGMQYDGEAMRPVDISKHLATDGSDQHGRITGLFPGTCNITISHLNKTKILTGPEPVQD